MVHEKGNDNYCVCRLALFGESAHLSPKNCDTVTG